MQQSRLVLGGEELGEEILGALDKRRGMGPVPPPTLRLSPSKPRAQSKSDGTG